MARSKKGCYRLQSREAKRTVHGSKEALVQDLADLTTRQLWSSTPAENLVALTDDLLRSSIGCICATLYVDRPVNRSKNELPVISTPCSPGARQSCLVPASLLRGPVRDKDVLRDSRSPAATSRPISLSSHASSMTQRTPSTGRLPFGSSPFRAGTHSMSLVNGRIS